MNVSDKRLWTYQGDKFVIWRKKIKDAPQDPDIFPNFLQNWCSLGMSTTIQYVEYWVYLKSVFVVSRVTNLTKIKMATMTRIFFKAFWKNDAAWELMLVIGIYM